MKKLVVFVAAVAILASCTSTKVVSDSVSNIDLSDYQTVEIAYQASQGVESINAINAQRVESAIKNETKARGLAEVEDAELKIVWGVGVDLQRNYSTHSTYHSHG